MREGLTDFFDQGIVTAFDSPEALRGGLDFPRPNHFLNAQKALATQETKVHEGQDDFFGKLQVPGGSKHFLPYYDVSAIQIDISMQLQKGAPCAPRS